jgi:hypothetical protein
MATMWSGLVDPHAHKGVWVACYNKLLEMSIVVPSTPVRVFAHVEESE